MSTREAEPSTAELPQMRTVEVSRMKSFLLINAAACVTILATLAVVCIPFPGLRVTRQIETFDINLNQQTLPSLIRLEAKEENDLHMSFYLNTLYPYHSIGNVTLGEGVIPISKHCKNRFVASYYTTKPIKTPSHVNVYDLYSGAVAVTKFFQSKDPGVYVQYDSSAYVIPQALSEPINLEADVYDLLYGDVQHAIKTRFEDASGKIVRDVKFTANVKEVTLKIGQISSKFINDVPTCAVRTVDIPTYDVVKIMIYPLPKTAPHKHVYYLHGSNWKLAYEGNQGLKTLLSDHSIKESLTEETFDVRRVHVEDKQQVPLEWTAPLNEKLHYHEASADGCKYSFFFADRGHMLADNNLRDVANKGGSTPTAMATDRIVVIYVPAEETKHPRGFICTKRDLEYVYSTISGSGTPRSGAPATA
ncbi:phosphohistidine phosphatase [Babesia ovata]|uniref:Phosphohistidine phosphatase n=1 Tax=Babesia ovata TaxID=189622 RepID=A0A2H6KFS1_9APIC|nr:phosphohistidine phosphatase [Babesia ovata]GBE61841.1 phosphohistidine phosphatase [Babesia ovata]